MKIQCACGTKYAFDVTPEMARSPITFICQKCGVDSSQMVNQLIRQELGASPVPGATTNAARIAPPPTREPVVAYVSTPGASQAAATPPAQKAPGPAPLRVSVQQAHAPSVAQPATAAPQLCLKHLGQPATEKCRVCQKPICPQCMELFGYVCSPLCKAKAEAQGIEVPVYAHQKSAVEAREWRKVSLITGGIAAVVIALLGLWFWYAWFGSVPKVAFAVRFPEASGAGQCRLLPQDQILVLHGGILARHDAKSKKEVWSVPLIDKKQIAGAAEEVNKQTIAARAEARRRGEELGTWLPPTLQELTRSMEDAAAGTLHLHAQGENVWVSFPDKLVRYEWQTGKTSKEFALTGRTAEPILNGEELLLVAQDETGSQVTHLNLSSGESRVERIAAPDSPELASAAGGKTAASPGKAAAGLNRSATNRLASARVKSASPKGGSNTLAAARTLNKAQIAALMAASKSGQPSKKPLDPAAVASQAQNLPLPSKLALPATAAAEANQQRLMAAMDDEADDEAPGSIPWPALGGFERPSLLPDGESFVQFSVKLLESKTIQVQAMKAPPKKSALDGDVNAAATGAIANEILNEIQRDRGGDVVTEDVSRYQVTLHRPGNKEGADWVGEVVGQPELFPLKTVDVLAAGKAIWVIDKKNKKLWESKLSYAVPGGFRGFGGEESLALGEGPAVEKGDTLYLFDAGVLGAFDLETGNARWRLPAVGISGLHFDDKGMIYVNATDASPDTLRYANQIDISEKKRQVILKVNAKTGVTAWRAEQEGLVSYVSGKFVYSAVSYHAAESSGGGIFGVKTGLEMPSHVRIKRLDPGNGRVMWEHYQERAPLDMHFEGNTIQLLFRKELQVLRFVSL